MAPHARVAGAASASPPSMPLRAARAQTTPVILRCLLVDFSGFILGYVAAMCSGLNLGVLLLSQGLSRACKFLMRILAVGRARPAWPAPAPLRRLALPCPE